MSQFITNTEEFNIMSEAEISSILNHFNEDLISDVVYKYLELISTQAYVRKANIIHSLENNFKMLLNNFPEKQEEIKETRQSTYVAIINILCNRYNLSFNQSDDIDYYTAALYIWDFLVSNFRSYLANFFAKYIGREKSSLYTALNLDRYKKSKDSSTLYGKKSYSDMQITIISANIAEVINYMSGFDISLDNILSFSYDTIRANYISSIIRDNDGRFFQDMYCKYINENLGECVTDIRLELQKEYSV